MRSLDSKYGWRPYGEWSPKADKPPSFGEKLETWLGPWPRHLLYRATTGFGDSVVKYIVSLARLHGTAVIFFYLPDYQHASHPDTEVIDRYAQLAPVITVPSNIAQNRANWFDSAHMNILGATSLTPALSAMIEGALGPSTIDRPGNGTSF